MCKDPGDIYNVLVYAAAAAKTLSGKKLYRFGAYSNAGNSSGGVGTYYAGVDSKYVRMTSY